MSTHVVPDYKKPLPLDRLGCLTLADGGHADRSKGVCLMEAVAWVAGEPHSEQPACACPVLGAFGRAFNDGIKDDALRNELLKPLVPRLVGTRSTADVEIQRAFLAMDWIIRVHTPAWLDLKPEMKVHAAALRALPPIATTEQLIAAQPVLNDARSASAAAWDAAESAAWAAARAAARAAAADAAWDAAWDAAESAAGAAARAAAGAAARAAARAAAESAARAAARAAAESAAWAAAGPAARAAARAAAGDAAYPFAYAAATAIFKPVIETLQKSGVDLFVRMIEVGKEIVKQ